MKQAEAGPRQDAVARAVVTLRACIGEYAGPGAAKLPTVVELAARARVSHVTMQRAVREAVSRGELRTRRGSGLFVVPSGTPSAPVTQNRGTAWLRTANAIESDILSGRYRPGNRLPLRKQLCAGYGVCHATLDKAFRRLAARALLVPEGRGHRVAVRRLLDTSGSAVVLRAGTPRGTSVPDLRHLTDVMTLENACSRSGLRVNTVFYSYVDASFRATGPFAGPPYSRRDLSTVLGFVVFTRGLGPLPPSGLVRELAGYRRPVTVVDEDGECLQHTWGPVRNVRVFPVAQTATGGRQVGELLLGLGHCSATYVDPYPDQAWSRTRLAGLRSAFAAAGREGGVTHLRVELPQSPPTQDGRGRTVADIVGYLGGRLDSGDPLQAGLARLLAVEERTTLSEYLWDWLVREHAGAALAPHLDTLAQDPALTAVVGANDMVALHCLKRFERAGVAVPSAVSVAGFDDSFPAQVFELTSYDFNGTAAVQAAVDFVVDPRRPLATDLARDGVVEVPGFVKERRTTARARSTV